MYKFDNLVNRKNSNSSKWDGLKRAYGNSNLIPLWIADMDFEVLPVLKEALRKRVEHPTYGYTFAGEDYFNSIINWNERRHNLIISKEEIISVPGVLCALGFMISALTKEGDKVLINPPVYQPFFELVQQANRNLVTSPLVHSNGSYEINFENLEKKLQEGISLYIICNPHNPVGRVWELANLKRIVDLCHNYGTIIASDEIHSDFILSGNTHTPILNISQKAKEISLISSAPSKTFNLSGLKVAYIIAQNQILREKIKKYISRFHLTANLFGYIATETVYNNGDAWVDDLLVYIEDNAQYVVDFLKVQLPRVKTYVPQGTYLMWLNFLEFGLSQTELMQIIQNRAGLALSDGLQYGEEGKGFVRMNIGTTRQMLTIALEKLAEAFT